MKIGVIVADFNPSITDRMLEHAECGLKEAQADYKVVNVPGAFEIPFMAQKMARTGQFDALITLGCVVKGETDHYDQVCRSCVDGIQRVMLDEGVPVVFEVLMVENVELAEERVDKGYAAVQVAIKMLTE